MKLIYLILPLLILVACSNNKREVKLKWNSSVEEIESELNGRVKYIYELTPEGEPTYDRKGRRSKIVAKGEYFDDNFGGQEIYMIFDSLDVGETFQGVIKTKEKTAKIQIFEPFTMDTVTTDHELRVTMECKQKGIFVFSGELDYGTKFPFEYRFVVR